MQRCLRFPGPAEATRARGGIAGICPHFAVVFSVLILAGFAIASNETASGRIATVQEMLDAGRLDEAVRAYNGLTAAGVPADAQTAVLGTRLAVALMDEGRYREAEPLIAGSLNTLTRLVPEDPRLGRLWAHLGEIRSAGRRLGEAQRCYERALELQQRGLSKSDPELITTLSNLAAVHRERGQFDIARKYLKEALAATPDDGRTDAQRAFALHGLGFLELSAGKPRRARTQLMRALELMERAKPANSRHMASVLMCLAAAELRLKQYPRSAAALERASAIIERQYGTRHLAYAAVLVMRAELEQALGRTAEAERALAAAVRIQTDALGPQSPAVAETALKHAALLEKLGRETEAREMEQHAQAVLRRESGEAFRVSFQELKKESAP